jgi:hypothetical protein
MRPLDRPTSTPGPVRPSDEVTAQHVATVLKESPMSVATAWIASELRRARFSEAELRARLDSLGL